MEVFISWSGPEALAVALELREFLPAVHQEVVPWVSDKDINAGSVWRDEIRQALSRAAYSVICVTNGSVRSPWVHYEAGAIQEGFRKPVCPYLIGVTPEVLKGLPIEHLQWVAATREGTGKLLAAINQKAQRPLAQKVLDRAIAGQWKALQSVVATSAAQVEASGAPSEPESEAPVDIADEDAANLLTAWVRGLSDAEASNAVVFAELDARFRFPPGTARRAIQRAVEPTGYRLEKVTDRTALLTLDMRAGVASNPSRGWSPSRDGFGGF